MQSINNMYQITSKKIVLSEYSFWMLSGGIPLIYCSFWYDCGYGSIVYRHRGFQGSAASYAERSTPNKGESNSRPDVGEGVWVALFLLDANFFCQLCHDSTCWGSCSCNASKYNRVEAAVLDFADTVFIFQFFVILVVFVCLLDLSRATHASGLKIFTSKNVRSSRPQSPFALMSGRASSSEQVVLLSKVSPCSSWSMGLIWTSWRTSSIRLAKVSLISWRTIVYPPVGQCKACANENFWEQGHFAGVFMGAQLYLKHNPSLNPPFVRLNPYLSRGRAFSQLEEPFSDARFKA